MPTSSDSPDATGPFDSNSDTELGVLAQPVKHHDFSKRVVAGDLQAEILRLRQHNKRLSRINRGYQGLFEMAPVGFLLLSIDGHVEDANHSAAKLFGQPRSLLGNSHVQTFVRHEDRKDLIAHLKTAQQLHGATLKLKILRSDGQLLPVNIFTQSVFDDAGLILGLQMVVLDISEHKFAESELIKARDHLQHLAYHDVLTGLPNRLLFNDRLQQALLMASRRLSKVGLIYIDVDHFKRINDSLGHNAGDAFLREIAQRIRSCVRDVDTLARIGGDEFSMVLERIGNAEHVSEIAGKIITILTEPISIEGHEVNVTVSLGVAIYPDHATDVVSLIQAADQAMFRAKEAGRNQVCCYNPDFAQQSSLPL